jgi:hypothetical protein
MDRVISLELASMDLHDLISPSLRGFKEMGFGNE